MYSWTLSQQIVKHVLVLLACFSFSCGFRTISIGESKSYGQIGGYQIVKFISFEQQSHQSTSEALVPLLIPQVIFQGTDRLSWIGTLAGVHQYNEATGQWKSFEGVKEPAVPLIVKAICQTTDGKIWIRSTGRKSLDVYDGRHWESIERINSVDVNGNARSMFGGRDGKLWLALRSGLISYDNQHWGNVVAPPSDIEQIYSGLPKRYYNEFEKQLATIEQRWRKDAASLGSSPASEKKTMEAGLTAEVVVGLEGRNSDVWMGTSKAVIRYAVSSGNWGIHPLPERSGPLSHMYEDGNGKVWLVDIRGEIFIFDPYNVKWSFYRLTDIIDKEPATYQSQLVISGICQDKQGRMLFATSNGLIRFEESKGRWEVFTRQNSELRDDDLTALTLDRDGRIWLGTTTGLLVLRE